LLPSAYRQKSTGAITALFNILNSMKKLRERPCSCRALCQVAISAAN